MNNQPYIAYYRVSTAKQGRSGLGLEAQRAAVRQCLGFNLTPDLEYTEVETGKGSNALDKRPVLREVLQVAKRTGAVLIIAKLDRLARNVLFVAQLMESKVRFQCADMPQATELTLHIMAAMGQHERQMISERTKAALQAAKARGVKLGNPRLDLINTKQAEAARQFADRIQLTLAGYRAQGLNKGQTVEALNAAQVPTPRGGTWSYALLRSVERRLAEVAA